MKFIALSFLFFAPLLTQAQVKLRDRALEETQLMGQGHSQELPVSTPLHLKDPYREEVRSEWRTFLGVKAQTLRPKGNVEIKLISTQQSLDSVGAGLFPSLEFGAEQELFSHPDWRLNWGFSAQAGISSQAVTLVSGSGFSPERTFLNTTIARGGPLLEAASTGLPWLSLLLSPQMGYLNYTQTSSNTTFNFSEQAVLAGSSVTLVLKAGPFWSFRLEKFDGQLTSASSPELRMPEQDTSVGAFYTW
ncbi:MAG: hypothetical protein N2578_03420 [Bdellovibrionaceae bacterium]|nr:hypothetical protein [Pseudobdellovibrionaceae bacterium]